MTNLASIFKAIANTLNEETLHSQVIPEIGEYFVAKRCRLFMLTYI